MGHTHSGHLTFSLSENIENCLVVAILGSKCLDMTMHTLHDRIIFNNAHNTEKNRNWYDFRCFLLFSYFLYIFWNFCIFSQVKLHCGHYGGVELWAWHRAEKWRTVGRTLTYSGPRTYVRRAKKWCMGQNCWIKTGHPFLVEVSARRRGRWQFWTKLAAEMSERETVYLSFRRHLGFAVPTRGNTPSGGIA